MLERFKECRLDELVVPLVDEEHVRLVGQQFIGQDVHPVHGVGYAAGVDGFNLPLRMGSGQRFPHDARKGGLRSPRKTK